jgi:TonB-dependent receptor
LRETDVLPSLNLTFAPGENTNLRFAYSTTINRPDLRELSPFWIIPIEGGYAETGNPELKRAKIRSYDLRLEAYPGINELAAVSVFYKDLKDPIEKSIQGGARPLVQPINAKNGFLYGAEFESRFGLGHLSERLSTLAISGNLTLVESETDIGDVGVQHTSKPPLQGQSPYVVNLGLYYASPFGDTNAALLYNVFGERLSALGVLAIPDIYEKPSHMLDMTVSHKLGGYKFKLSLENLLDDAVQFEQEQPSDGVGFITHRSKKGRSISLSVSVGS